MNTSINNYQQNNFKILVAETVFKGVFNKRQLINHLSDNIAPKETARILNELIKDKLVRIGQVKEILEIDDKKLDKVKGIEKPYIKPGPKVEYKLERKKKEYVSGLNQRAINYKFVHRTKWITLYYQFSYKNEKLNGTIQLKTDTDIDTLDVDTLLNIHAKEKYTFLKDVKLIFNKMEVD
jgi:hypothetical protein